MSSIDFKTPKRGEIWLVDFKTDAVTPAELATLTAAVHSVLAERAEAL